MDEIKDLRAVLRMTQEEFARACGVSRATVANWEQSRSHISNLAGREILRLVDGLKGEGAEKC